MNKKELEIYMEFAIREAKKSLKKGNNGFGAIIIKNKKIVAKAHDTDNISKDPTAHAEINAIRKACNKLKRKSLKDYILISTHEPCPMCATACVWAKISKIVFGASINDTIKFGRKRILINTKQIVKKSPIKIKIIGGIKKQECIKLYE